jgi:hypothetical protein
VDENELQICRGKAQILEGMAVHFGLLWASPVRGGGLTRGLGQFYCAPVGGNDLQTLSVPIFKDEIPK